MNTSTKTKGHINMCQHGSYNMNEPVSILPLRWVSALHKKNHPLGFITSMNVQFCGVCCWQLHKRQIMVILWSLHSYFCTLILSQSRIQTNHFTDGLLKDVSVFFFISSCQMGTVELGKFVWANFLRSFYWFELKMFLLMKFHCYAQSLMNKDHVL